MPPITIIDVLQLLVLPVLLPAVVGLATRWQPVGNLPQLAKRLILASLALTTQVLTEFLQAGDGYGLNEFYWSLFLGAIAIVTAELTYQYAYKAAVAVPRPKVTPRGKILEASPAPTLADVIGGREVNEADTVDGYAVPVDPAEGLTCESCQ